MAYVPPEEGMPTFSFDPLLNPIAAYKCDSLPQEEEVSDSELDDFEFPEELDACLADEPLGGEEVSQAIEIHWAPAPFNTLEGKMRRGYDVPLVSHWFKEHCP